ncbi:glycosyltransferase [Megalodesulfovibrio paquesii]
MEIVRHPTLDQPLSSRLFAAGLLRGVPGTVLKYQTAAFSAALQAELMHQPQLIHVEHIHLAGMISSRILSQSKSIRPRISLDAHNIEWTIARRMAEVETSRVRKTALALHALLMRRYEERAFRACDLVLAVSAEDAAQVAHMSGEANRAVVVENGVDTEYFHQPRQFSPRQDAMVFTGSMDWAPNVDGMVWFCREILPRIQAVRPNASLTIVGRTPRPEVLALHRPAQGVVVTGAVDDVRPYVHGARVALAPLRFGGGTRLKILEAFAMGTPVVSTAQGCEGIACRDGEHLLIRNPAEEVALACLQLLESPELARQLSQQAHALALARYTWPAITARMGRMLLELLQR